MYDLNLSPLDQRQHRLAIRYAAHVKAAGLALAAALATCALAGAGSLGAERSGARDAIGFLSVAKASSEADDSLASALEMLGKYDRVHDDRALLEALRWFERKWETGDGSALAIATPLHARVCRHHLLQWNWLCESGE